MCKLLYVSLQLVSSNTIKVELKILLSVYRSNITIYDISWVFSSLSPRKKIATSQIALVQLIKIVEWNIRSRTASSLGKLGAPFAIGVDMTLNYFPNCLENQSSVFFSVEVWSIAWRRTVFGVAVVVALFS